MNVLYQGTYRYVVTDYISTMLNTPFGHPLAVHKQPKLNISLFSCLSHADLTKE